MKTVLYVVAIAWSLIGLGSLIGGQQFWMGSSPENPPSIAGAPDAVVIGWYWVWTFAMPSLLAGALGAILGRLDEIRDAVDFSDELDDVDETHPEPEDRVDPYIGEGYLTTGADKSIPPSRRGHKRI